MYFAWIVCIILYSHALLFDQVLSCSVYVPKALTSGVLHNPNYPYPEYVPTSDCQFVFDLYTPNSRSLSMLCITFQRFNLPTSVRGECRENFMHFGITRGAIICGTWNEPTIQYIGNDAKVFTGIQFKWPTICYTDDHLLEVTYKLGEALPSNNQSQTFFATYDQYMFDSALNCSIPNTCVPCRQSGSANNQTFCPACASCLDQQIAADPVWKFGCTFNHTICNIISDRTRWDGVYANTADASGPLNDHTYGDFNLHNESGYIYLDESLMHQGEKALILLPSIPKVDTSCLQFWFYMAQPNVGRLELLVDLKTVWYREGPQGVGWQLAQVELSSESGGAPVKFVSTALYTAPERGGLAIDDLSLIPQVCPERRDISCTFETGLCGWVGNSESGIVLNAGLIHDHTEIKTDRNIVLVESAFGDDTTMTSPFIDIDVSSAKCLTFWHYKRDAIDTTGTVSVRSYDTSVTKARFKVRASDWTRQDVTIVSDKSDAYQIVITFQCIDRKRKCYASLDDVQLADGLCPVTPSDVSPTTQQALSCLYAEQVRCDSGECIYHQQMCDAVVDCRDGSDEGTRCGACALGQFQCLRDGCIPVANVCDNIIHCSDGSDESPSFANCNQVRALSVGAIIGSSFGVLCLCVLLITLCAWGCVHTKNRRLGRARRAPARARRSRIPPELEPYMINCPEAPPSYFSVVNYGFETGPYDSPPSYDSVVGPEAEGTTPEGEALRPVGDESTFSFPSLSFSSLFPFLSDRTNAAAGSRSPQEPDRSTQGFVSIPIDGGGAGDQPSTEGDHVLKAAVPLTPLPPAHQPSTPVQLPSSPAQQPPAPAQQPSAPAQQPSSPAQQPPAPAQQPSTPVRKPSGPPPQPPAPARKPPVPVRQSPAPAQQPSAPVRQPSGPPQQPPAPARQTPTPAHQPLATAHRPPLPAHRPQQPPEPRPQQPPEPSSKPPTKPPTKPRPFVLRRGRAGSSPDTNAAGGQGALVPTTTGAGQATWQADVARRLSEAVSASYQRRHSDIDGAETPKDSHSTFV